MNKMNKYETIKSACLTVDRETWFAEDAMAYFYKHSISGNISGEIWIYGNYPHSHSLEHDEVPTGYLDWDRHYLYYYIDNEDYQALVQNQVIKAIEQIKVENRIIAKCSLL